MASVRAEVEVENAVEQSGDGDLDLENDAGGNASLVELKVFMEDGMNDNTSFSDEFPMDEFSQMVPREKPRLASELSTALVQISSDSVTVINSTSHRQTPAGHPSVFSLANIRHALALAVSSLSKIVKRTSSNVAIGVAPLIDSHAGFFADLGSGVGALEVHLLSMVVMFVFMSCLILTCVIGADAVPGASAYGRRHRDALYAMR